MLVNESVCRNCVLRDEVQSCELVRSRRGGKLKDSSNQTTLDGRPSHGRACQKSPFSHSDVSLARDDIRLDIDDSKMLRSGASVQETITRILRKSNIAVMTCNGSEYFAFEQYYLIFHQSHPFLPPAEILLLELEDSQCMALLNGVLAIGYRLLAGENIPKSLQHSAIVDNALARDCEYSAESVHYIQLLLMQSILHFVCNEREQSAKLIHMACDLVRTTGTLEKAQCIESATTSSADLSLLRTIWEIWMCDIMTAALSRKPSSVWRTSARDLEIATPFEPEVCSSDIFLGPEQRQLQYVDIWSPAKPGSVVSYAYLIAAFDLLRGIIALINGAGERESADCEAEENMLDSKLMLLKSLTPPILLSPTSVNYLNFRSHMVCPLPALLAVQSFLTKLTLR